MNGKTVKKSWKVFQDFTTNWMFQRSFFFSYIIGPSVQGFEIDSSRLNSIDCNIFFFGTISKNALNQVQNEYRRRFIYWNCPFLLKDFQNKFSSFFSMVLRNWVLPHGTNFWQQNFETDQKNLKPEISVSRFLLPLKTKKRYLTQFLQWWCSNGWYEIRLVMKIRPGEKY